MGNRHVSGRYPDVSIGVPAYNESAHIGHFLDALCRQREERFLIREIVVVSDGSSDGTDETVLSAASRDGRIRLVSDGLRKGKPSRVNDIMKGASSDIVVLLDADIVFEDDSVLSELIRPLLDDSSVMHTSGYALPIPPSGIVDHIASAGSAVWERARRARHESKLYFSEGRIRAFRREMYQVLKFPDASADEAYSFLFGEKGGFPFVLAEKALVRYRLPSTVSDYVRQMKRFLKSEGVQSDHFDPEFSNRYYTMDFRTKMRALLDNLFIDPFWTALYVAFVPIIRVAHLLDRGDKGGIWYSIESAKDFGDRHSRRVAVTVSSYDDLGNPHYAGGGALAIHETARRLSAWYDVTVITGVYPGASRNEMRDGVRYRRIGVRFGGPLVGQAVFWCLLPFVAFRHRSDVWIDSFTPPFGVSLLPLILSRPVIGLIHMLPGADMWRKYRIPFFLVQNFGLRWYRHFIVLTGQSREAVRRYARKGAVIDVIPNGVDIPDQVSEEKRHLLFLGRIEMDQKGIDLLLEAFSRVSGDIRYPLVIAGSGSSREVKKLGLAIESLPSEVRKDVRYVGRLSGKRKTEALLSAVAVVIPSRFETFSITALEAFAHGAPVVSFDISGFGAFPDECVYRACSFDTEDLSCKILEAVRSRCPDTFYRSVASGYSWDSVAARFRSAIDRDSDGFRVKE